MEVRALLFTLTLWASSKSRLNTVVDHFAIMPFNSEKNNKTVVFKFTTTLSLHVRLRNAFPSLHELLIWHNTCVGRWRALKCYVINFC